MNGAVFLCPQIDEGRNNLYNIINRWWCFFQKAFSGNDPYKFFDTTKTDSEMGEFTGLKELLGSIFHLV